MIYDDTICQLGEGAFWHPIREQFFWFDILGKRLHTKGKHWQFDDYVSAAGWIDRDHILIASSKALLEADIPANRSNDGRADPQGGFWIGTMGLNAEPAAGASATTKVSCARLSLTCKSPMRFASLRTAGPLATPTPIRKSSCALPLMMTAGWMDPLGPTLI